MALTPKMSGTNAWHPIFVLFIVYCF